MTEQPRGNFRNGLNRSKKPGDKQPVFDRGIISTPDAPDERFEAKIWGYKDKHGRPFFAGPSRPVSSDPNALERAHAVMDAQVKHFDTTKINDGGTLQLGEHQMMLFPNTHNMAKTDPHYLSLSEVEKTTKNRRQDHWACGTRATIRNRFALRSGMSSDTIVRSSVATPST